MTYKYKKKRKKIDRSNTTLYGHKPVSKTRKIVALVMFPMDLRENWNGTFQSKEPLREEKYVELKRLLENKFNRPVFKLGDEADETALYEKIIDFFTAE